MRKLILTSIISFLFAIAFIYYLKYDTQRFIKELPSLPDAAQPSVQQAKDTAKNDSGTDPDSIIESTTEHEKASTLPTVGLPAGTSEDVTHSNRPQSKKEKIETVLESGQTLADTGLSPEVIALYTDFQPLYYEYAKVGAEYIQATTKMLEIVNQKEEITKKLNATSDPETAQKLRGEKEKLQNWIDANYSTYKALRDETYKRTDAMQTLVESRGFSYRHFDWNAFFTWRGELSK